jgi:hypothetical protein
VVRLPLKSRGGVSSRARTREDRAGDPLDGLVNLFDLGIVLSVAFLLAALSSLDLESAIFSSSPNREVPEDTVVAKSGEEVRSIRLNAGERVVGRGEPVGTVYRLTDGRTIIVQDGDDSTPGTETPSGQLDQGSTDQAPTDQAPTDQAPLDQLPDAPPPDGEPTLGGQDNGDIP